jgi:hypothetical protein
MSEVSRNRLRTICKIIRAQRADNCAVLEDVLAAKKTAKNSTFERSPKMQNRLKKQNLNEAFDL